MPAKLSEFDAIRIRVLLRLGMSRKNVATLFGIAIPNVCNIANGKKWPHVKQKWQLQELIAVVASHRNEWHAIPTVPGLWAHPSGQIRNKNRGLKQQTKSDGYLILTIGKGELKRSYNVHVLIAETFLGPRPEGLIVEHIDRNRGNARKDNLEYITQKENTARAIAAGAHNCTRTNEDNHNTRVTNAQLRELKQRHLTGVPATVLAGEYGISVRHAFKLLSGKGRKTFPDSQGVE